MFAFKFFWTTHKWTGILLGIVFLNLAVTGYLLLVKKDYDWIQPPSAKATAGRVEEFASLQKIFAAVIAENHPDFRSADDVDRIDFRPGKRLHKVRSKHNHAEIQVDAVTGAVLQHGFRASDLIEQIHDGTFFGGWAHDWLMPVVAGALLFLVVSGLYIWIAPILKKRRRRLDKARAAGAAAEMRS